MLTQERYHMIEELVNRKGAVTITELTKQIPASESTIRRDLQALDELGKVKKYMVEPRRSNRSLLPMKKMSIQKRLRMLRKKKRLQSMQLL